MNKKTIMVLFLLIIFLSSAYAAKPPTHSGKDKDGGTLPGLPAQTDENKCGYLLNGVWYKYECCIDEECGYGSTCIDHECVKIVCAGDVNLNLEVVEGKIRAKVEGVQNCNGKTVRIKEWSCEGTTVCSFVWNETECYFEVPSIGVYEYFACLDTNGDGEYSSDEEDGEKIVVAPYTPPANQTENQTSNETSSGKLVDVENEESPFGVCVPIGLIIVIFVLILFPWVHETLNERKGREGRRKRR